MMNVTWTRNRTAKRLFSIVLLGYLAYLGFARCVALVHADQCRDAGGKYDAAADSCRR